VDETVRKPIVYSWISWIQGNLLEALQMESGVLSGVHSSVCNDPRIGLNVALSIHKDND